MSSALSHNHLRLIGRFLLVGVANTALGYSVIFALMAAGFNPYWSNLAGYAVGMLLAFTLHKGWVFRAKGQLSSQSLKFAASVIIAYAVNLATLKCLIHIGLWPYGAQIGAGITYTASLLFLSSFWVFTVHAEST